MNKIVCSSLMLGCLILTNIVHSKPYTVIITFYNFTTKKVQPSWQWEYKEQKGMSSLNVGPKIYGAAAIIPAKGDFGNVLGYIHSNPTSSDPDEVKKVTIKFDPTIGIVTQPSGQPALITQVPYEKFAVDGRVFTELMDKVKKYNIITQADIDLAKQNAKSADVLVGTIRCVIFEIDDKIISFAFQEFNKDLK